MTKSRVNRVKENPSTLALGAGMITLASALALGFLVFMHGRST